MGKVLSLLCECFINGTNDKCAKRLEAIVNVNALLNLLTFIAGITTAMLRSSMALRR